MHNVNTSNAGFGASKNLYFSLKFNHKSCHIPCIPTYHYRNKLTVPITGDQVGG